MLRNRARGCHKDLGLRLQKSQFKILQTTSQTVELLIKLLSQALGIYLVLARLKLPDNRLISLIVVMEIMLNGFRHGCFVYFPLF